MRSRNVSTAEDSEVYNTVSGKKPMFKEPYNACVPKKWLMKTGPTTVKNALKEQLRLNARLLHFPRIFCLK